MLAGFCSLRPMPSGQKNRSYSLSKAQALRKISRTNSQALTRISDLDPVSPGGTVRNER